MKLKLQYKEGKLKLDSDDFKKMIEDKYSFDTKMHLMIDHLVNKSNLEKENLEICQVGKFLVLLDENISIKSKNESPDFIIEKDDKIIGLEHETIRNMETVPNIGSIRTIAKISEKYFIENYPDCLTPFKTKYPTCPKMIVDIRFVDDLFSFKKSEVTNCSIEIAQYIASVIKGTDIEKPKFLSSVSVHPHTRVNFIVHTDINKTQGLNNETLNLFIKKKELKVKRYREQSGISEQWLLLVAGSLNRDSYEIEKGFGEVQSDFDRIYLLDDFKGKYYKLK